jgi:hypothetical protein
VCLSFSKGGRSGIAFTYTWLSLHRRSSWPSLPQQLPSHYLS